ncbi:cell division cycle-associated protein 4 [Ochotona princeps]|uniref:cell division cycle-associated protein 4 n=1 Tax=Ochotona princeps TaxID=9978 RepID=UPI0027154B63|nr:cell division cycle-associated protein 4 [Ochotona princeps]XP_058511249.1 cell division cycle-associated protein 4 [Ochotona princeps]
MFARGLKRKSAEPEEDVPSYSLQRQSLLDMSLVKLQLCHMLVEPDLCRSVLIANTVRQIQDEMSRDGSWRAPAPPGLGRTPLDHLVSTDILCRPARELGGEGPVAELSLGRTAAQAPRDVGSSGWGVGSPQENRGGFQKSLDHIFETLESKSPGCVEELLADVDSPYYDLDTVLTGMMGGPKAGSCDGLEGLATGTPPTGPSCRPDLGDLERVVEILVGT